MVKRPKAKNQKSKGQKSKDRKTKMSKGRKVNITCLHCLDIVLIYPNMSKQLSSRKITNISKQPSPGKIIFKVNLHASGGTNRHESPTAFTSQVANGYMPSDAYFCLADEGIYPLATVPRKEYF